MSGPKLPDISSLIQAGIDPKTGLPVKLGALESQLKSGIKAALRIVDEQDAVNRYKWTGIPCDLSSQEIERMLYYKYQIGFYFDKDLEEFLFLPMVLDGSIDFYGRWKSVHPVPFYLGTTKADKENYETQSNVFSMKRLKVQYGVVVYEDELTEELFTNSCVLLKDYTSQYSQTAVPRANLQDPILDIMAECIPMMRTNLTAGTGVKAIRVNSDDESCEVELANRKIKNAALSGELNIPIQGKVEFQELNAPGTTKSEEYMLAMQSLDNFRLSLYGIDNGGLFEKKAHELQSEADINGGPVGLVNNDGLMQRQNFCNIVNSIYGLNIWCEINENVAGADINGDGLMYDRNTGESSGLKAEGGEGDEK